MRYSLSLAGSAARVWDCEWFPVLEVLSPLREVDRFIAALRGFFLLVWLFKTTNGF